MKAFKKPVTLTFVFAADDQVVETLEGPVTCKAGDAIVSGTKHDSWPIPRERFEQTYDFDPSTGRCSKKMAWVEAEELTETTTVKLGWSDDSLTGQAGDFLVTYSDNDQGIVERDIFFETYVVVD